MFIETKQVYFPSNDMINTVNIMFNTDQVTHIAEGPYTGMSNSGKAMVRQVYGTDVSCIGLGDSHLTILIPYWKLKEYVM